MPDIDFQKIELNLIPKKGDDPVVFYASQYETARPFIAVLKWGDSEFAPGVDCYAEIDIRKNDDNLVVITDDVSIDNNEVSVILPVQALTCIGKNLGQVKIYAADDNLIAALNFIIEVQGDPLAGGVTSETAIDNLTQQIEDITQEVIGEDYYNKTETDALLADKADKSELPDMTDYYTKTQTDNLLNDKADVSDLATLASKAEVTQAISDEDIALKNWVSSNFATPGYVATHYYSKLQVDDIINNMLPVGSASGNPCIFDTEYPYLIQGLKAEIVCGGGGGTPSTPIPIVGHSELNLTRCGVNQFDEEFELGTFNTTTGENININNQIRTKNLISVIGGQAYYFKSPLNTGLGEGMWCMFLDRNHNVITPPNPDSGNSIFVSNSVVITPLNACYVKFYLTVGYGTTYNNDVSINYPSTDTTYHAYNGQTFTVAFGQTVYGGLYDKSGRLTITHGYVDLGSLTWIAAITNVPGKVRMRAALTHKAIPNSEVFNAKCDIYTAIAASQTYLCVDGISGENTGSYIFVYDDNYSTSADLPAFISMVNGHYLAYELATPIVIDVPSISVFAENGVNNIVSDCLGDVSVTYIKKV